MQGPVYQPTTSRQREKRERRTSGGLAAHAGLPFCGRAVLPAARARSTGTRATAVVGLVACITW